MDGTDSTGQTEEPGNTDTFKVTGHEDGRLSRARAMSFVVTCFVGTIGADKTKEEEEADGEAEETREEEEEDVEEEDEVGGLDNEEEDESMAGNEEHPQL